MIEEVIKEIKSLYNEKYAQHHTRFFKTGKGEYGEGDKFLGLMVPQTKSISKKYFKHISLEDTSELIKNEYHEIRLAALHILVLKYKKADEKLKKKIYELYLKNTKYINNWDLVDLSAPYIVGDYVYANKLHNDLWKLAKSNHLWSERIAVVANAYLIRQGDFETILNLAEYFLPHKHDLMHKAVGWMLRETGKKDIAVLSEFLDKNAQYMPRTMLRYAIERYPEDERQAYLKIKKIN